jgi:hypothetical protein
MPLTILSGDIVYLRSLDTAARISSPASDNNDAIRGSSEPKDKYQSLTIELRYPGKGRGAEKGGKVNDGSEVGLKSWNGRFLDVEGNCVGARWNHFGDFQSIVIAREQGLPSIILFHFINCCF